VESVDDLAHHLEAKLRVGFEFYINASTRLLDLVLPHTAQSFVHISPERRIHEERSHGHEWSLFPVQYCGEDVSRYF